MHLSSNYLLTITSFIKLCWSNDKFYSNYLTNKQKELGRVIPAAHLLDIEPDEPSVTESDLIELSTDFVGRLNLYITDDGFDFKEFDSMSLDLIEMLSLIVYWEKELVRSLRIACHIKFSRRMFLVMNHASHVLRLYAPNDTGHYLLCSVVQMNVRLLSLFEADGSPNYRLSRFRHTLTRFSRVLQYLRELFQELRDVSPKVKQLFDSEVREATLAIRDLGDYTPTK